MKKIGLLENNTIERIKANVEKYELAKLLRSTDEPSVGVKKRIKEVNYLKHFIKSLKVNDNTDAEPKGKNCSNSNHCCQNTDYGNGNGSWSNSSYNNCLPNVDFRHNNFSPNINGSSNWLGNIGHANNNGNY